MFCEETRIKQGLSYIFCPFRILYNSKFILMAPSLGTNAVVVTRVHCTIIHPLKIQISGHCQKGPSKQLKADFAFIEINCRYLPHPYLSSTTGWQVSDLGEVYHTSAGTTFLPKSVS